MSSIRTFYYTSYPKTGSTFLPSLIDGLTAVGEGYRAERFTFAKSGNNIRLDTPNGGKVFLLKSHHTFERFFQIAVAESESGPAEIQDQLALGAENLLNGINGLFYTIRNPFATLASAIQYSKLIYPREVNQIRWSKDGRLSRYFMDFLQLPCVPTPTEFNEFRFLDLPASQIEDICWRFVEGRGGIPFLEARGEKTYFEHINHHQRFLSQQPRSCVLSYEALMQGSLLDLQKIASLLDLPVGDLQCSLNVEAENRAQRSGRYASTFFSNFQVSTPARIFSLPSWRELRASALALCPALAITLAD